MEAKTLDSNCFSSLLVFIYVQSSEIYYNDGPFTIYTRVLDFLLLFLLFLITMRFGASYKIRYKKKIKLKSQQKNVTDEIATDKNDCNER